MADNSPGKLDNGDFPKGMSQPALRALQGAGIKTLEDLTKFSEKEIAKLHGMGPTGLVKLNAALAERGLSYAERSPVNNIGE